MPHEPSAPETASPWLDTAAAARHLGREPGTLRGWRSIGKGPAFHVVSGRFVRYHVGDLEAWVSGGQCRPPDCVNTDQSRI